MGPKLYCNEGSKSLFVAHLLLVAAVDPGGALVGRLVERERQFSSPAPALSSGVAPTHCLGQFVACVALEKVM